MPYAAIEYPKSARPYTFYTDNKDLTPMERVLVRDKNGFSLCKFIAYVPKPAFQCNFVVMSEAQLTELTEAIQVNKDLEENYPGDNEDEAGNRFE